MRTQIYTNGVEAPYPDDPLGGSEERSRVGIAPRQSARPGSLYEMEDHLVALADTAEMVGPDQEEEFLAHFHEALATAAEKRDRVANFLAYLEAQQSFADLEIGRLQALKKHYATVQQRLEGYVSQVIESLGRDDKGKYRKLEGRTTNMFLAGVSPCIEVFDEAAVPLQYKRATVTLPACLWDRVLECLPSALRDQVLAATRTTLAVQVEKRAVKNSIDLGESVPGAKLITGRTTLRRR